MSDTPRTDDEEMSPRLDIEGMIVSSGFARQLERELAEAREQRDHWCDMHTVASKQRDTLAEAVRSFVTDYEQIQWGYDGDGGSQRLVDHLFEALAAVKGGKP